MTRRPPFASSSWHQPVTKKPTPLWTVSDNGENVVAFGPNNAQAEFQWGTTLDQAHDLIVQLGSDEFTRQMRAIYQTKIDAEEDTRYNVADFTVPDPGDDPNYQDDDCPDC